MSISVIIPTYNRPECIARCVECLLSQEPVPEEIIIVDASSDNRTRDTVLQYPSVKYINNPAGRGNTPHSRNLGLMSSTGDIIAFLDDDAFVRPGWMSKLEMTYEDPSIGAVAGRALNGQPGEESLGTGDVGKLRPDGTLAGNFAADTGYIVDVDHMIGCNMSMRREIIERLGGFRDDFRAGPFGICEETELCLRAKRIGSRIVFNPAIIADHIGAPQPGGRRFSAKYHYYHTRNNLVMLIRNFSRTAMLPRFVVTQLKSALLSFIRRIAAASGHLLCVVAGLLTGTGMGTLLLWKYGGEPIYHDERAERIRNGMRAARLSQQGSSTPADQRSEDMTECV